MSGKITFAMIKPNSVEKNQVGAILKMVNEAGFVIRAMKMKKLSREEAETFYAVHKDKSFFCDAINFIMEAPVIAMMLEKENAVEEWRKLIGSTNKEEAEEGTIRKLFAENITRNAVHGADCDEAAKVESSFFFSRSEMFFYPTIDA